MGALEGGGEGGSSKSQNFPEFVNKSVKKAAKS